MEFDKFGEQVFVNQIAQTITNERCLQLLAEKIQQFLKRR